MSKYRQQFAFNSVLYVRSILLASIALATIYTIPSAGQQHHGPPPDMSAEMKAAVDECATELSLPKPGSETRPTQEQRAKMSSCLEAKGFTPPQHGEHKGLPPDEQNASDN